MTTKRVFKQVPVNNGLRGALNFKAQRNAAFIAALFIISAFLYASYWTVWNEYPSNPVLDPATGPRAYYPSVIYNSSQFSGHGSAAYYKMWFAQDAGIAYAYSDDGIVWTEYNNSNPLAGFTAAANHPAVVYDAGGFGGGLYYYKIWYWTGTAGAATELRYAESVDGINWVNHQPIQQHATDVSLQVIAGYAPYNHYFYHMYGPGTVLYNPAATNTGSSTPTDKSDDQPMTYSYVMYYDSSSEGTSPEGSSEQTSLAYSVNGIYWIRYGDQPVLIPSGNAADWDGMYRYRVSVVRVGTTYHLWYSGANGDNSIGTSYAHGIGHATSTDGLNWTIDADNPAMRVTDGIAWRSVRTYTPSVIYDSALFSSHGDPYAYKMWYTGRNAGGNTTIGYAGLSAAAMPPVACFTAAPINGFSPLTVNFNGNCSTDSDGVIVNYSWNFGDNSTGNGIFINHTYTSPGQYLVTLTVRDNDGLTDTSVQTIIVENPLQACITTDIASGYVPFSVTFDASCSRSLIGSSIIQYKWFFPGDTVIDGITSVFQFAEESEYTITLQITDELGNTDTASVAIRAQKIYSPTGILLQREINRSLARAEAYHTLIWSSDLRNANLPVERYNIYRKNMTLHEEDFTLIGSTDKGTLQYIDKKLPFKTIYAYYITTVLSNGFESSPSSIVQNSL